jgi:hypothetical protein
MFWVCAALSAAGVLEPVICSFLLVELTGYRLRRILQRARLPYLDGGHIGHHFLRYGPQSPRVAPSLPWILPVRVHRTKRRRYHE